MNKHDRDNLNYILSLTEAEFEVWYASISQDDAEYAMELIQQGRAETANQLIGLLDTIDNTKEARKVLAKFTLSGKVTVK